MLKDSDMLRDSVLRDRCVERLCVERLVLVFERLSAKRLCVAGLGCAERTGCVERLFSLFCKRGRIVERLCAERFGARYFFSLTN